MNIEEIAKELGMIEHPHFEMSFALGCSVFQSIDNRIVLTDYDRSNRQKSKDKCFIISKVDNLIFPISNQLDIDVIKNFLSNELSLIC